MSEPEPKLTPTFADKIAAGTGDYSGILISTYSGVTAFPASRAIPEGALAPLPPPVVRPQREKVAIIGTAPSSRALAPFNDPEWEIWACSPGNMGAVPRVDVWFEIHANLHWPEHEGYGKNYIEWLSKQTFPVYMQDNENHKKYFPHAISFPEKELVKQFGSRWFTSSFAWMMALAISKGYKEIALYGVDMASKDEYILQRQAFYYWLEKAESQGIKVTIPAESDLLQSPGLYGFSDVTRYGRKKHARKQELLNRIAQIERMEIPQKQAELKSLQDNALYLKGAVEDIDYDLSIWIGIGHNLGEH